MRRAFLMISIGLLTLLLGSLAIIGCLLIPNGNALIWFARPWARGILMLCGTRVRVRGVEWIPRERAVIYATNHQSLFDVPALVVALPGQYRMIAKKELFAIPVFGWALWLAGFIKIDRSDREKAFQSLDRAADKIRGGMSVVVFPEGTRSPDGSLQPFKKGGFVLAIRTACPLVPISISGSRAILSKNSLEIQRGVIDVVIGEPLDAGRYSFEQRDELIAEARRAIESGFSDLKALDAEPTPQQPARGV